MPHDGGCDAFDTGHDDAYELTPDYQAHMIGIDHFHLRHHSSALDTDGDGFSDAVERDVGTSPLNPLDHPQLAGRAVDADQDGFSDRVELSHGTDPSLPWDHPIVVEAHHRPAGSLLNGSAQTDVRLDLPF